MKFFRVATEGATTDGRVISREWIQQMADNYDPKKYGARVWLEHMRGVLPDGPFAALGDVTAVKAEEVEDGKLALFVQLDPTDQLKAINAERQKIYTSIEIDHDFADTGEAYLIGLAVTDSPASLGTEMLQFSAKAKSNPLTARKQRPENLFTAAIETTFDFSEEETDEEEQQSSEGKTSLKETVKALFAKYTGKLSSNFSQFESDLKETLELFVKRQADLETDLNNRATSEAFTGLQTELAELKQKYEELYTRLDMTPDQPQRKPATGDHGGAVLTDC